MTGTTPQEKFSFESRIFAGENYFKTLTAPILELAVENCYKRQKAFNFSDVLAELPRALKELGLTGYEHKNLTDKIKLRLSQFIRTGEILNCKHGYPFDFWLNNDICLNVAGASSEYLSRYFTISLQLNLWRYYERNPLPKPQLRTLFVWHESRTMS